MKFQAIDKFEYDYVVLNSNIIKTIEILNKYGKEGWELFKLFEPKTAVYPYQAILKRKITEYENNIS